MVKIGLEIHVQLNTESKFFCSCPNPKLEDIPNSIICEICTSQPGSKPSPPNAKAIEFGILAAHMLNCKINEKTYFMRKHYFYPDLPSGYQRTSKPIGENGNLNGIGIWEIHVEEDPGKFELKKGIVDYNRSGTPLIEVVTAPDFKNTNEVREFLNIFDKGLRYYNIVKENGVIKADANISVEGGERVEVKNINSFQNIITAINYEIKRQTRAIEDGKTIVMETRHFDEAKGITKSMRKKETEADYRYMPDPDLLPIELKSFKNSIKNLEERPWERSDRLVKEYNIDTKAADELTWEKRAADLFEYFAKKLNPIKSANWIRVSLKKQINYRNLNFSKLELSDSDLLKIAELFFNNKLSDDGMEKLLIYMLDNHAKNTEQIAKKLNLFLVDTSEMKIIIKKIIENNPKAVEDYKKGEQKALSFLIGQVMKESKGKVNPKEAKNNIETYLK